MLFERDIEAGLQLMSKQRMLKESSKKKRGFLLGKKNVVSVLADGAAEKERKRR